MIAGAGQLGFLTRLRQHRCFGGLAPLAIYIALALVFFGRWISWRGYFFGYTTDSLLFVWFLNWWPFAITHGLNPFICKYVWFPGGYNVAWATSVPVLAFLLWPVTAFGGPVLAYNIVAVTAPAFTAWTGYLLLFEVTKSRAAALAGGFLFGFSAPELYQLGQLNLSSVCLVPLAALLCLRRVKNTLKRRDFVILLSLLLAAQLGISTEILAELCLMGALAWLSFLLFSPAATRRALWRLALDIALAVPLTMCLAAPLLYYLIKGLPEVPQDIHPFWIQMVESLNFLSPAVPVHSLRAAFAAIARQLRGYAPDYFTYVSAPVLLILLLNIRHITRPHIRALLAFIIMAALLSLGPVLMVNGKFTGVLLPWMLFSHIPVIRSIIPVRFVLFLTLAAAVIAALWLAEAPTFLRRLPRFALAGLACLFLPPAHVQVLPAQWQLHNMFEDRSVLYWSRWPEQAFFTPGHIKSALGAALGAMPDALLLPDPVAGPGTAWQLGSGLGFTQTNGYVGLQPVSERQWSDLAGYFAGGAAPSNFPARLAAFCAAHRLDYILAGPGAPRDVIGAIENLGWPHHMDNGIEIIKTPAHP